MQPQTKIWYLNSFNLKGVLTIEERRRIAAKAKIQCFSKKEVVYFPQAPAASVYILKEGKVKISSFTADGKEIILGIVNPGEFFGELALAGQQEREERAEVMEDAVLCIIGLEDMKHMMQSMPSLNIEILKQLGGRVKKVQSRLEAMICKNSDQRIRSFIKDIAQAHGRVIAGDPEQVEVKLSLTHADIAKLTATCRQNVSSHLRDLEKQDLIKYDRRRIYIRNISAL